MWVREAWESETAVVVTWLGLAREEEEQLCWQVPYGAVEQETVPYSAVVQDTVPYGTVVQDTAGTVARALLLSYCLLVLLVVHVHDDCSTGKQVANSKPTWGQMYDSTMHRIMEKKSATRLPASMG